MTARYTTLRHTALGALVGLLCIAGTTAAHGDEGSEADASDSSSIESRYLSNIRQVTDGFVKAGEGYFSPDGQTIVSASWDNTVRLWIVSIAEMLALAEQMIAREPAIWLGSQISGIFGARRFSSMGISHLGAFR